MSLVRPNIISVRRFFAALSALLAVALLACQSTPPSDPDTVPPEEAKKHKIIYRAAAKPGDYVPPRTVEDILAALRTDADVAPTDDKAAALVRQAPPATKDERTLAAFYWERGRAAQRLGLVQQQIADLCKAAEYGRGISARDVEDDRILAELAGAETQGGNLLTALKLRQQAFEAAVRSKSIGLQMSLAAKQAELYSRLGERKLAQHWLDEAEALLGVLRSSSKHTHGWAWYQHNWPTWTSSARATLLEDEGKYQEAEPLRRRVLADREADIEISKKRLQVSDLVGAPSQQSVEQHRGNAETQLALNLVKQERLTEAEAIIRKQLGRALRSGSRYRPGVGNSFLTLSRILYEEGRYPEARQLADIAIDIYVKTGVLPESVFVAQARRARAAALTAEGRWAEAIAETERMQSGLARDAVLLQKLGRGDLDWALALARAGRAGEAIPMLEALLASVRERLGEEHYEVAEIRGFLGLAHAAAGHAANALRAFHEALPVLTAGMDSTDGQRHSPGRVRRLGLILEAYLGLLADPRAQDTVRAAGLEPIAETFRVADHARGQSVQRALSSNAARAAATDPKLAELVRREQDASQRIGAVYELIASLLSAPPSEQPREAIERLRREAAQLSQERRQYFAEIEKRFPAYANLLNPKPPTLDQVRHALAPGEVLVSVYVGAERTFVWAVPKQGEVAFAVADLGEKQVAETVARLRKALDPGTASLGAMPAFDVTVAYQLYARLLQPVARAWKPGDSLLVVPHRALGQLPFVLLPTAPVTLKADTQLLFESYRDVPWLVRQVAVTQLPSANALVTLRALPPGDAGRRMFAGFGDPLFNAQQLAEANAEQARPIMLAQATTRRLPLRNLKVERVSAASEAAPDAPAVANSSRLAQVPRLPDTADEIREIAAALKADEKQDVYLQLRASEEQVKRANLANRRVLVFATHGLVPGELDGLNQPALALTSPELTHEPGDGLLTMDEVLALKLNADWVVLSACNTAAGEGNGGEAISGLGRAFFYAGTRALLVTHWPVETTSARALTTGVFRHETADPALTRAQALRQTMLDLIDTRGYVDPASNKTVYAYAHPLFWAPYALVGDGGK